MKQIGFATPACLISVQLLLFSNVWKYLGGALNANQRWKTKMNNTENRVCIRVGGTVALCVKCNIMNSFRLD